MIKAQQSMREYAAQRPRPKRRRIDDDDEDMEVNEVEDMDFDFAPRWRLAFIYYPGYCYDRIVDSRDDEEQLYDECKRVPGLE